VNAKHYLHTPLAYLFGQIDANRLSLLVPSALLRRSLPRALGFMNRHLELLNSLEVSEEELVLFKDDNSGSCRVDTARVSHLLLAQLSSIRKYRALNSFAVTDIIQKPEGVGRAGLEARPAMMQRGHWHRSSGKQPPRCWGRGCAGHGKRTRALRKACG
jgi:hypothetical protein